MGKTRHLRPGELIQAVGLLDKLLKKNTPAELARKLGVSDSAISWWKVQKRFPNYESYRALWDIAEEELDGPVLKKIIDAAAVPVYAAKGLQRLWQKPPEK